jgi:hypothetical protein
MCNRRRYETCRKETTMKRTGAMIAIISIISLAVATESFGQRGMHWRGGGGWGMNSQYGRMYDPKTVETISGEVERVDTITPMKGMSGGVHLLVKTDKESISVHLGPAWYLENQDVKIEPKDKVEITGSRITFDKKPAIIAKEVKKGEEVLNLRDDNGYPVWSGWRRR